VSDYLATYIIILRYCIGIIVIKCALKNFERVRRPGSGYKLGVGGSVKRSENCIMNMYRASIESCEFHLFREQ